MKSDALTVMTSKKEQITKWLDEGISKTEIAGKLGIPQTTFYKHFNKLNILSLEDSKVKAVSDALYKKAIGYDYVEQVVTKIKSTYYDDSGNLCTKEEVIVNDTSSMKSSSLRMTSPCSLEPSKRAS